jgi:fluoride exporter
MKSGLLTYLAVGLGAGLGGICRYAITALFVTRFGPGLPLGTFFINLSGSFAIGLISELAQTRVVGIDPLTRVALTAGFLGGYTTFSTFAFETRTLAAEREWAASLAYAVGSVTLGVAACYAGIVIARLAAARPV